MKEIFKNVLITLGLCAIAIIDPVLTFWVNYFGGWILALFVGDIIVDGLNAVFNTTRFTPEFIPLMCATIAVVGEYFKSYRIDRNSR